MFFNEDGILDIDELVAGNASFRKIMEDGIVTEEEIKAQSDKVVAMLNNMESSFTPQQLEQVKHLLSEMSVLYAVYNYHSIQSIS